jgi:nucleotide-binding universal stress UspA family protein
MYKHLLLPTDGSPLAARGYKAGIKLAKSLGARVTGVYVTLPYVPALYGEGALFYVPGLSPQEYRQSSKAAAEKALAPLEREAARAAVRCASRVIEARHVHEGILQAARRAKCDAICMATHGRGGLGGLILGSETQRVLAHAKLPIIIVR